MDYSNAGDLILLKQTFKTKPKSFSKHIFSSSVNLQGKPSYIYLVSKLCFKLKVLHWFI